MLHRNWDLNATDAIPISRSVFVGGLYLPMPNEFVCMGRKHTHGLSGSKKYTDFGACWVKKSRPYSRKKVLPLIFFQIVSDTLASIEVPHEVERETTVTFCSAIRDFVCKHSMPFLVAMPTRPVAMVTKLVLNRLGSHQIWVIYLKAFSRYK